jgi:hypothetical protein
VLRGLLAYDGASKMNGGSSRDLDRVAPDFTSPFNFPFFYIFVGTFGDIR